MKLLTNIYLFRYTIRMRYHMMMAMSYKVQPFKSIRRAIIYMQMLLSKEEELPEERWLRELREPQLPPQPPRCEPVAEVLEATLNTQP